MKVYLVEVTEDKGVWGYDFNYLKTYNPETYTKADLLTQGKPAETMLGTVPGKELKSIWKRWGEGRELLFFPEFKAETVDDNKAYRLHTPIDMYIKLGQRQKALVDPQPGPDVLPNDIIPEIFK